MMIRVGNSGARAGWIVAACLLAAPVASHAQQTDYEAIVRTMRDCARIEEVPARVACYDATIQAERLIAGAEPAAPAPPLARPAAPPSVTSAQAQAPAPPAPGGFGAETLRRTSPASEADAAGKVTLAITRAEPVEPGIYMLTLEDGSQWRFVDAVPASYDLPRAGATIELARGALGGFRMNYGGQRPVRIRRVQ